MPVELALRATSDISIAPCNSHVNHVECCKFSQYFMPTLMLELMPPYIGVIISPGLTTDVTIMGLMANTD